MFKNSVIVVGGSGSLGCQLIMNNNIKEKYDSIINIDMKLPDKQITGVKLETIVFNLENDDFSELYSSIKSLTTGVSGLVFMPGINSMDDLFSTTEYDMMTSYKVNTVSLVIIIKYLLDLFLNNSSIICIASQNGISHHSNRISYGTSKAGLLLLIKNLTIDLASMDTDIRINAISPTYIKSNKNKKYLDSYRGTMLLKNIPYKRFLSTEEVIDTIFFLLSDSSKGIRAQNIIMDYGYTITHV